LAHVGKLSKLKALWLTNAPVTDAALPHLRRLTGLEKLYLQGTKVTGAGVSELKKALPECRVYR
jgi:hypothetical protein